VWSGGVATLNHRLVRFDASGIWDERLAILKPFAFLKSLRLFPAKEPFSVETQAKIRALLPNTKLEFK
jgi:hypothetical protein